MNKTNQAAAARRLFITCTAQGPKGNPKKIAAADSDATFFFHKTKLSKNTVILPRFIFLRESWHIFLRGLPSVGSKNFVIDLGTIWNVRLWWHARLSRLHFKNLSNNISEVKVAEIFKASRHRSISHELFYSFCHCPKSNRWLEIGLILALKIKLKKM